MLWFYIRRGISADSSYNLHLRDSEYFFILRPFSHTLSLKSIKFFVLFLQILILEILPGDSEMVPKVMPCIFYLDLRFFFFYCYKQLKIKIGHLDRESSKYVRQMCETMKYETKQKEI